MTRQLVCAIVICAAADAWALDPIVNANHNLSCNNGGGETFYPYGDVWAFMPGKACKGTEPTAFNANLDAETADRTTELGHCIWVSFDKQGPLRKSGTTGTDADAAERARKTVFAAMRKWAGYRMGKATLGSPGYQWWCPTTSQPAANPPVSYTTKVDYDFGQGNKVYPSFNFFRAPDVEPTITLDGKTVINRGDSYACYAECASGEDCKSLGSVKVGAKALYTCTRGKTATGTERHKVSAIHHNVSWVQGAGQWQEQTGAGPEVLASTEAVFWQDNGVIISTDMNFNNENQDWRFHDTGKADAPAEGCDPNQANCYYLETVATHEAGHFIGFGHVNCTDAVMVPSAKPADQKFDLSKHDTAGVCSVYRPSAEGRYPTTSREGEGCFKDADCGSANKCYFAKQALYNDATSLAALKSDAERLPYRGLCVKQKPCTSDTDCDPSHGRVCQELDATTGEKYCVAGSPSRPRPNGTVADFCAPCNDGTQCNGICASTADMGIAAAVQNAPAMICTAKCDPALGCASGFSCNQLGQINVCVPNDPGACISAGASTKASLNENCTAKECAAGLSCYAFSDTEGICLEACSKTQACKTPNYGCLLSTQRQADNTVKQLSTGACFKKQMAEGDNCALPSNAMCGLSCTGTGAAETCARNQSRVCITDTTPEAARCFSLCSTATPCSSKTQSCVLQGDAHLGGLAIGGQAAGLCNPPKSGMCLKGVGESCAETIECDSGMCQQVGANRVCTQYCDLANRSGCPAGTTCVNSSGKGVCGPEQGPLTSRCAAPSSSGCSCAQFDTGNWLELALSALLILAARRRARVIDSAEQR